MSALPVASWRMIKEQEQELQTMLLWESEIPEGKKRYLSRVLARGLASPTLYYSKPEYKNEIIISHLERKIDMRT